MMEQFRSGALLPIHCKTWRQIWSEEHKGEPVALPGTKIFDCWNPFMPEKTWVMDAADGHILGMCALGGEHATLGELAHVDAASSPRQNEDESDYTASDPSDLNLFQRALEISEAQTDHQPTTDRKKIL